MTERLIFEAEASGRPTGAKPKSPQGVTDCHVGLRPPRNESGVLPRPTNAVKRDVEEKVNWPNGPREAGLDHAVPYESGILDCKIGAVLCSRTGLPLRFSVGYGVFVWSGEDK